MISRRGGFVVLIALLFSLMVLANGTKQPGNPGALTQRGGPKPPPDPAPANRPPVVRAGIDDLTYIRVGEELRFRLHISDPDGDPVSLRLLNPPPGLAFPPVRKAESPCVVEVSWLVPDTTVTRPRLVFRAEDGNGAAEPFDLDFLRRDRVPGSRILTGDVTGDGVPDVIGGAILADAAGIVNSGAVYVWEGGAAPASTPLATLGLPAANLGDQLGNAGDQGIHLIDITADGILDIVVGAELADEGGIANTGAVYVYEGGALFGNVIPAATLSVPGAGSGDLLGSGGILFEDVTGDGDIDVIVGSSRADAGGVSNSGAVYVFEGGPAMFGPMNPLATLAVSTATAGDQLGLASGQGIRIGDVTGDAQPDIIVGAQFADLFGIVNVGAVHVWNGGSTLVGPIDPDITLNTQGVSGHFNEGDRIGLAAGQGIQLADVTGDGTRDIVVGAQFADNQFTGVDVGAVYVWHGGIDVLVDPFPDAVLAVDPATDSDQLGNASGQGVLIADVTDDGTLDVIAGAQLADEPFGPVENRGAIYIWRGGGTLTGSLMPDLTLEASGSDNDRMGDGDGQGILLADITGDGRLELFGAAPGADFFAGADTGLIHYWDGNDLAMFNGNLAPTGTFDASFQPGDRLGDASGQGIQFADLDADGILDMIAGAQFSDQSIGDGGAIHIWRGDANPSLNPDATLDNSIGSPGDRMGNAEGQGIQFADLDGDGALDVVAGAVLADHNGITDSGAIHVWLTAGGGGGGGGGISLPNGSATLVLHDPSAMAGDRIGSSYPQGIRFADITDDGVLDVIAGSPTADTFLQDCGRLLIWEGGSFLSSTPLARLEVFSASQNDQLTEATPGFQLVDLTDDGVVDVLAGAQNADLFGVTNSGAIYLWAGSSFLNGTVDADVTFEVPGAAAGDRLGR